MATRSARKRSQPIPPDPDVKIATEHLIDPVVPHADVWKHLPKPHLAGKTPMEVIDTPMEDVLRNDGLAARHGAFS